MCNNTAILVNSNIFLSVQQQYLYRLYLYQSILSLLIIEKPHIHQINDHLKQVMVRYYRHGLCTAPYKSPNNSKNFSKRVYVFFDIWKDYEIIDQKIEKKSGVTTLILTLDARKIVVVLKFEKTLLH